MEVISQSVCSVSPLQLWGQALPPNSQCEGDSAKHGAAPAVLPTFPLGQARDGHRGGGEGWGGQERTSRGVSRPWTYSSNNTEHTAPGLTDALPSWQLPTYPREDRRSIWGEWSPPSSRKEAPWWPWG